jgi:hypothetical protein
LLVVAAMHWFGLSVFCSIQFAIDMNLLLVCMLAIAVLKEEIMDISGSAEEIIFRAIIQTFLVQNLFLLFFSPRNTGPTPVFDDCHDCQVAQFIDFSRSIIVAISQLILALHSILAE